jgi:poly(3-hydroxybutyrate) depolymerase
MQNIEALRTALSARGKAAIPFIDPANADRPLTLHTYRPESHSPEKPVVLVQHGMLRNGDEYRDFWIPAADKHGLLIVATTFSNEAYPEPERYNNGLVFDDEGAVRPKNAWTYGTLAGVFAALRKSGLTTREKAHLFGHSAGGQFVHRLLSTQDAPYIEAAIAGNPGWYSLPTLDKPFPEGLGGIGMDRHAVERLLAFPLTILAGDQDIATDEPSLPQNPEALAQGPHRFARAHNYFAHGRREAERLGIPFRWTLQPVAGIGHDGEAMSAVAACIWFDGAMPSSIELERLAGSRAA